MFDEESYLDNILLRSLPLVKQFVTESEFRKRNVYFFLHRAVMDWFGQLVEGVVEEVVAVEAVL